MTADEFNWTRARVEHTYPSVEILGEIGRVAIAAARGDQEVALVLVALKGPDPFEELKGRVTCRKRPRPDGRHQ